MLEQASIAVATPHQPVSPVVRPLRAWVVLRCVTWLWLALLALLVPLAGRATPWPPTTPLANWLHQALVEPWNRWDTRYYLAIVARGYRADDGTAQFHPLLAWLATPLSWLLGSPLLALLLVASAAGAALLVAFERLARLDLSPEQARVATLLLVFAPPACILFAPYTEGLFLLWAVLCLLWARQGRWWLAGLAGGLATLTRQQGLFLLLPLAWEMWHAYRLQPELRAFAPLRYIAYWLRNFSGPLSLIPAGLFVWLGYRALALGDLSANLSSPQALIYSLLISPSSSMVVPEQAFLLPPHALWLALTTLVQAPELSLVIDLLLGAAFVALLVYAWRGLRPSYQIWALAMVLVSFGYYTGSYLPYMGLPRHLLLAFPLFIGLGARWGTNPRVFYRVLLLSGLGSLFLLLLYHLEAWVP